MERLSVRVYVTDWLHLFAQGKAMPRRWYDIAHHGAFETDAEQVIEDIIERAGLVVRE